MEHTYIYQNKDLCTPAWRETKKTAYRAFVGKEPPEGFVLGSKFALEDCKPVLKTADGWFYA